MASSDDLAAILQAFREEARDLVQTIGDTLLDLEQAPDAQQTELATIAFRAAHNIKGAASTLDLPQVEGLVHALEEVLVGLRDGTLELSPESLDFLFEVLDRIDGLAARAAPGPASLSPRDLEMVAALRALCGATKAVAQPVAQPLPGDRGDEAPASQPPAAGSTSSGERSVEKIRIAPRRLDLILEQLTELTELKIRWEISQRAVQAADQALKAQAPDTGSAVEVGLAHLARDMEQDTASLGKLVDALQEELRSLRLVPIRSLLSMLRRAARDVCRRRELEVSLTLDGGEVALDRAMVEELQAPMLHLVRNAVDHGMESGDAREAAGKPRAGRIAIKVAHRGDGVSITVHDDGRGLDDGATYRRAVERGLLSTDAPRPGRDTLRQLLFTSGMSTSTSADSTSGRGVGLDAVRRTVERLRGTVDIASEPGNGTTFTLHLPLTLSSEVGLFVVAGDQRLAIPRTAVRRALAVQPSDIVWAEGVASLMLDGDAVPLAIVDASTRVRPFSADDQDKAVAVVVEATAGTAAIAVDDVAGEAEIVVRSLGSFVTRLPLISGVTVSSAGEISYVLDPADLVSEARRPQTASTARRPELGAGRAGGVVLVVDDSVTARLLNRKLLETAGFETIAVEGGRQALEVLHARSCDLVLTDVEMPHMDGYALCRSIKADPALAHLPVVLLTALDSQAHREQGLAAGADAYLVKRLLSTAELAETIQQLI